MFGTISLTSEVGVQNIEINVPILGTHCSFSIFIRSRPFRVNVLSMLSRFVLGSSVFHREP